MKTTLDISWWLVLCAAVCLAGCRPSQSPTVKTSKAVAEYAPVEFAPVPVEPTVPVPSPVDTSREAALADAKDTSASSEASASTEDVVVEPSMAASSAKPATWTTERLVVTGRGGPRFIKLDVNVGQQDLETGFQTSVAQIAQELQLDFTNPCDWNTLLDKPLIASGWLGNLVPNVEQREQLRGLYDSNKNERVDESEFRAFLTRGLSRTPLLKIVSRNSTAPRVPSSSIWGPIDKDENGELSPSELADSLKTMSRFDFDGDRVLTTMELRSGTDRDDTNTASGYSMLELKPVHVWNLDKPEKMARTVCEHYSFTEELSSDVLKAWPAGRAAKLDTNQDSVIDLQELAAANDELLDAEFRFALPDATQANVEKQSVNFRSIEDSSKHAWHGHLTGGRLTLDGCIVTIVFIDEQSEAVRDGFRAQFGQIAKDAQVRSLAMQALELKEGAMDCLNSFAEAQDVPAADVAWRWLVAPRHRHVQIAWSTSESPWFELMDLNGDQLLAAGELEQFSAQALRWDDNKDGAIQPEEMPISVLLEVKRAEARGLRSRLGGTAIEKRGANESSAPTWFTGMDYNSDGELSLSEFLGDQADFEKFDRDRNGIIEAREVTTPQ